MPIRSCLFLTEKNGTLVVSDPLSKYNCGAQSNACILPPEELRGVPVWEYTLITIVIFLSASSNQLTRDVPSNWDSCSILLWSRHPVMITAVGTLVFIHKRQRLRRHQALRDYYFEQMELSRIHTSLRVTGTDLVFGVHSIASVDQSRHYTPQP